MVSYYMREHRIITTNDELSMEKQNLCMGVITNDNQLVNGDGGVETQQCLYIDQYEIEDILGEYYDFSSTTNEQWLQLDSMIKKLCAERGVTPFFQEEYTRICDVCCERLKIKRATM